MSEIHNLGQLSPATRATATAALIAAGRERAEKLVFDALQRKRYVRDPARRVHLAAVLAHFGNAAGREQLIEGLSNGHLPVQFTAAWGLAQLGKPAEESILARMRQILDRASNSEHPQVAVAAKVALARLTPP
ncbi:MAG TPA: HEAT repeat domain-containing protein [Candidatus Diapherotrites archaeon]|uniref:HEAT repeat domain-containing protein n=1 Tax=Candidatus Iainarchaeum sp. TaxID=3101447 RepID=A0A7J4JJR4_9ARCH|nr:HEAT repeat domain-containing protein [Candidatus Diapherotrites archaeon]HIH16849.1 HEAT repeat domain-containing protein [Candidatus Diapherotrites archaeon]